MTGLLLAAIVATTDAGAGTFDPEDRAALIQIMNKLLVAPDVRCSVERLPDRVLWMMVDEVGAEIERQKRKKRGRRKPAAFSPEIQRELRKVCVRLVEA